MVDPVWALAVAGGMALLAILALWPGRGALASLGRRLRLRVGGSSEQEKKRGDRSQATSFRFGEIR